MRQILFQIPLDRPWSLGPLGEVPGFGFGIVLLVWTLIGIWSLVSYYRENRSQGQTGQLLQPVINWTVMALLIAFGAPALGAWLRKYGSPPFRDGLPIFGYGFMLLVGVICATWLAARRARKVGLSSDAIWDLAVWLFVPGIIGARLFYLVQYGDRVFSGLPISQWPLAAINLSQGGIILYGALLGGAVGYFSFCYFKRIRPLGLGDIVVPSVFVGIGFGRIGCLLNGCCYGKFSDLPWAIQFPREAAAFGGLLEKGLIAENLSCTPPLHPTQIYSSIDGFVIAAITSWYFWRRRRNGEVLALALIIYPITRFCIELLRADEGGQFGTNFTISQLVSMGLFLINLGFMYYLSRRPPVRDPIVLPDAKS